MFGFTQMLSQRRLVARGTTQNTTIMIMLSSLSRGRRTKQSYSFATTSRLQHDIQSSSLWERIGALSSPPSDDLSVLRRDMAHIRAHVRCQQFVRSMKYENDAYNSYSYNHHHHHHRYHINGKNQMNYRNFSTTNNLSNNDSHNQKQQQTRGGGTTCIQPMDKTRLYQYLELQTFTEKELKHVFDRIISTDTNNIVDPTTTCSTDSGREKDGNTTTKATTKIHGIKEKHVTAFLLDRICQIEIPSAVSSSSSSVEENEKINSKRKDTTREQQRRMLYAQEEAQRFLRVFNATSPDATTTTTTTDNITITKDDFVKRITDIATEIDIKRLWPISFSILLVGTSVGIVTPAMPFVVENIGLSPGQYGTVVSAFGLAKLAGNIPSAIFVERHGRKPYLTYSLAVIALGVGGIGAASSFEQLYACRLLTGAGVAALTTASQLMVTDLSTPLNRATTMSPIVSAFAAGTALGPAFGGYLVDHVGLEPTFYLVGSSYLGVALLNKILLVESKRKPFYLPDFTARDRSEGDKNQHQTSDDGNQQQQKMNQLSQEDEMESLSNEIRDALGQWAPLLRSDKIRSIMVMNGFYWFALSGAQMTLLPLILTSPSSGLNMTASGVGHVYMLMSVVQVMSNPIMARYLVDRIGKVPAIAGGCAVIASSMTFLPLCTNIWPVLVFWALGSSMLSTAPLAYISDKVQEDQRAQAIAILRTSGDIGFLFGASCIGGLADTVGSLELAMQSSGGFLSAATLWFVVRQSMLSTSASLGSSGSNNVQTRKTHDK